jgi:hypothetical protein
MVWFALLMAAMLLLTWGGAFLGFALNLAILRAGLGWPWHLIRDAKVCPDGMLAWLAGQDKLTAGTGPPTWSEDLLYDADLDAGR